MDYINETLKILMERRSVRAYRQEPIEPEHIDAIKSATLRAPTAGNMMLYSVINITDQDKKDSLSILCDNQSMIAKAPMLWIFAADYQKWDDYFHVSGAVAYGEEQHMHYRSPEKGNLLLSISDALIAAQTAVTAAESLHIGSCYIGDILENYEEVRKLLTLPQYVLPITMVCFGYPKGAQKKGVSRIPRHVAEDIFHSNSYTRKDDQALRTMFHNHDAYYRKSGRITDIIPDTAHYYYIHKQMSQFMKEMNRSVSVMLKNWL